jgi:hypothetical protein
MRVSCHTRPLSETPKNGINPYLNSVNVGQHFLVPRIYFSNLAFQVVDLRLAVLELGLESFTGLIKLFELQICLSDVFFVLGRIKPDAHGRLNFGV